MAGHPMDTKRNKQGLTPQQENFARGVANGLSQAEAYRQAYPNCLKWTDKSIWGKASLLARHAVVSARVTELKREITERVVQSGALTVEGHLAELARLRDIGVQANQIGSAITAEMARGKVAGFYIDRKETGDAGDFAKLDAMRKQDAMSAIEAEINRRARLGMEVSDVDPKE